MMQLKQSVCPIKAIVMSSSVWCIRARRRRSRQRSMSYSVLLLLHLFKWIGCCKMLTRPFNRSRHQKQEVLGFSISPLATMSARTKSSARQPSCLFISASSSSSSSSSSALSSSPSSSSGDLQSGIIIPEEKERQLVDIVICGGGPCGLLSGIMLSQKFPQYKIQLYDERNHPAHPNDDSYWSTDLHKRYLIGLGGRGITSLERFNVWDAVVSPHCQEVPRRIDWNSAQGPEPIETIRDDKRYRTQVLPRDKLVSCLYQHIIDTQQNGDGDEKKNIYSNLELCYGWRVEPVNLLVPDKDTDDEKSRVWVDAMTLSSTATVEYDSSTENALRRKLAAKFVVAADGSTRTFANEMERLQSVRVVRYEDDNQRVYKNIPFRIPLQELNDCNDGNDKSFGWNVNTNYAVRTDRVIFDALPANDNGDFVGVLLLKANDEMARPNVDPDIFRSFIQEHVPQFVNMFDDTTIQSVAERPPSFLPRFRYVSPRMHQNYRTVLMGDCAKTVKPYFGMGANSALEDVKLLAQFIDDNRLDLYKAIGAFSNKRSPDIETLVRISHDLDRPGVAGTFSFLIPIILDGIFSKLLPQVFAPNIIALLQDEELTFQDAAMRKRSDRIGQVSIVSTALVLLWEGARFVGSALFQSYVLVTKS